MLNVLIVVSKQCENTFNLVEKPIIANWSQTEFYDKYIIFKQILNRNC
jgi:hypothetical protein